jgi:hypothetical protein
MLPVPLFAFRHYALEIAPSPSSSMLVQGKFPFCNSGARDEGGSLETGESSVPPGPGLEVLLEPVQP